MGVRRRKELEEISIKEAYYAKIKDLEHLFLGENAINEPTPPYGYPF